MVVDHRQKGQIQVASINSPLKQKLRYEKYSHSYKAFPVTEKMQLPLKKPMEQTRNAGFQLAPPFENT